MKATINYTETVTLAEWLNMDTTPFTSYIHTAWGYAEVAYVRDARVDPWAVCPKENGGFGQSFCIHGGTTFYLVPRTMREVA